MILSSLLVLAAMTSGPRVEMDVLYSRAGGEELKIDLFHPTEESKTPRPAVLIIHGGAWMMGKRSDMDSMARYAASKGLVAATVQYRLAPKHKWPAMLDDVQTAVRFLRANSAKYNIDPDRIGAAGASAGGHLALFLGSRDTRDPKPAEYPGYSSRVAAVFDVFGPVAMADYPQSPTLDFMFAAVLGKPRKDAAKEIDDASPINFIDKNSAPVFIFQGLADLLVNPDQSRKLEKKYKELGIPVQSVYLEGVGHEVPMARKEVADAIEQGVAFLLKHLNERPKARKAG
ncbi:MAG TPA: alpha/beta hydrolase [Fimbriimonadaceae bacterium]|nr:alpha/beta hydrolase [Fimbriimonadaceae bacterium]